MKAKKNTRLVFMNMCIEHNLFTCGSKEMYDRVISFAVLLDKYHCKDKSKLFEAVVCMVYICSAGYTLHQIREIVNDTYSQIERVEL